MCQKGALSAMMGLFCYELVIGKLVSRCVGISVISESVGGLCYKRKASFPECLMNMIN